MHPEPREECARCERPLPLCYCAHLSCLPSQTRVVFLQHPKEAHKAIGTARMAHLCLPNSELHVGVRFSESILKGAALLYPGPGATDISAIQKFEFEKLVVVDGTWFHAKKLVRENPALQALPRFSFQPPKPSEYRIRREPKAEYLSTLESLAHVLTTIEGTSFAALHQPFEAMVEAQLNYARASTGARHRLRNPSKKRPIQLLRERPGDVVCVAAEANVWSFKRSLRARSDPGELVHLTLFRPSTEERFEAVVRPRRALSNGTLVQTELSAQQLEAGLDVHELRQRLSAFLRPSDLLVSWGLHSIAILRTAIAIENAPIDLRALARLKRVPIDTQEGSLAQGRAGKRLFLTVRMLERLVSHAAVEPGGDSGAAEPAHTPSAADSTVGVAG